MLIYSLTLPSPSNFRLPPNLCAQRRGKERSAVDPACDQDAIAASDAKQAVGHAGITAIPGDTIGGGHDCAAATDRHKLILREGDRVEIGIVANTPAAPMAAVRRREDRATWADGHKPALSEGDAAQTGFRADGPARP